MSKPLEMLLDPLHRSFDIFEDKFVQEIWEKRYKAISDGNILETFNRVAHGIAKAEMDMYKDPTAFSEQKEKFYEVMKLGLFIPAGRILASAGIVGTKSTLQNCYVSCKIEDSMEGIHKAFAEAMTTLGRFGGIGTDFTPIRPKGAKVGNQGLTSPGVIKWMEMFHDGADRVKQAGHRRGAMMGTLRCDHPDIEDFIVAKHTQGTLTNFNVSVLITDEFMDAVQKNKDWMLFHEKPTPAMVLDGNVNLWYFGNHRPDAYIYKTMKARELWEKITRSTYKYSEPGVIFIDRINQMNNLAYCEDIQCTNPCGEQPLPPYGACNLGHINLSRLVLHPFEDGAVINWDLLRQVIPIAVRFLDNVIDVSEFPLDKQKQEQVDKRRIGLGVTGLADMLIQLGIKYGSPQALELTERVMKVIAMYTYLASTELAKHREPFPLYQRDDYVKAPFVKKMIEKGVNLQQGIRNSLLLTVAPVGTTSIVFGNISSGIEPVFAYHMERKVSISNTETEMHRNEAFISRFYHHVMGRFNGLTIHDWPAAIKATEVTVDQHVAMQGVVQEWIDASVTKTVNCPEGISYEDFVKVYDKAYAAGCKGTTTYIPSEVRGFVIQEAGKNVEPDEAVRSKGDETVDGQTREPSDRGFIPTSPIDTGAIFKATGRLKQELWTSIRAKQAQAEKDGSIGYSLDPEEVEVWQNHVTAQAILASQIRVGEVARQEPVVVKRPEVLVGCTYKIKWQHHKDNIYLTVNENEGRPFEIFVASMDLKNIEWTVASCLMVSRCLRNGENLIDLAKMLQKVQGAHEGAWAGGKYYTSLVQYIGVILEQHAGKYDAINMKAMPDVILPDGTMVDYKLSGSHSDSNVERVPPPSGGNICPDCMAPTLVHQEGCLKCGNCGYNKCG